MTNEEKTVIEAAMFMYRHGYAKELLGRVDSPSTLIGSRKALATLIQAMALLSLRQPENYGEEDKPSQGFTKNPNLL